MLLAILFLIGLMYFLFNYDRSRGNDFQNEEEMFNLFLKQSLTSLLNTETKYKGNGSVECSSFGSIIATAASNCLKVCNSNSTYYNESAYNITNRILRGYIEYLNKTDDDFYYYIGLMRKNLICNGRPVAFEMGKMDLKTYDGEKFTAIEHLPTTGLRGSSERIELIVVKKENFISFS